LDLAALFMWIVTAVVGLNLLAAGKPASRPGGTEPEPDEPVLTGGGGPGRPGDAATAHPAALRIPPMTQLPITTGPDEHPLLEFAHPALALIGLGLMIAFAITHFTGFAWGAFGVIVATVLAGLAWFFRSRAVGRRRAAGPAFPAQLIRRHGAAAALTLLLALVTLLSATHA
jgi:hypothetical protein